MMLVQSSGMASAQSADGALLAVLPGTRYAAGSLIQTGDGEVEIAITGRGSCLLREVGSLQLGGQNEDVRLLRGAIACKIEADRWLTIATPHLRVRGQGLIRLLTMPTFSRIDVVAGTAEVTDLASGSGRQLATGQALAAGLRCRPDPLRASRYEFSPREDGLLYRWAIAGETARIESAHHISSHPVDLTAGRLALSVPDQRVKVTGDAHHVRLSNPTPHKAILSFDDGLPDQNAYILSSQATMTGTLVVIGLHFDSPEFMKDLPWTSRASGAGKTASMPDFRNLAYRERAIRIGETPDGKLLWDVSHSIGGKAWIHACRMATRGVPTGAMFVVKEGEIILRKAVITTHAVESAAASAREVTLLPGPL